MRPLLARLVLLTTVVFVALAVSPPGSSTLVIAGIAAVLAAVAVAPRPSSSALAA